MASRLSIRSTRRRRARLDADGTARRQRAELQLHVTRRLPAVLGILGEAHSNEPIQRRRQGNGRWIVAEDRHATAPACFPEGLRPVAISYSTAPSAKMSVRASASVLRAARAPCTGTCRGSSLLRQAARGGRSAPRRRPRRQRVQRLARPKSSSFAPDFVIMTLPGFRSRWTIPSRCARSSASAISAPYRNVLERQRTAREPLRERFAVQQLHHEVGTRTRSGLSSRRRRACRCAGCVSCEIVRASRSKRSRLRADEVSRGGS